MRRSERLRIMDLDKKDCTPNEIYKKIQINKDLESRKRDKGILIFLTILGLFMAILAPKEISRNAGIGIMFVSSLLSILA